MLPQSYLIIDRATTYASQQYSEPTSAQLAAAAQNLILIYMPLPDGVIQQYFLGEWRDVMQDGI